MSVLNCQNCGGVVEAEHHSCPHCGIPLPPNHATQKQRTFIIWFILLVIFCFFMMMWLPPDWSPLVNT